MIWQSQEFDLTVEEAEEYAAQIGSLITISEVYGGLPSGGNPGDIIIKNSEEDYDASWYAPASVVEDGNGLPVTSEAVYDAITEAKEAIHFAFVVDDNNDFSVTPAVGVTVDAIISAAEEGKICFADISYTDEDCNTTLRLGEMINTPGMRWVYFTGGTYVQTDNIILSGKVTNNNDVWAAVTQSNPKPYNNNPAALGVANPGNFILYARGDHVHPMPSAADIGAYVKPNDGIPASDLASDVHLIPSGGTIGQVLRKISNNDWDIEWGGPIESGNSIWLTNVDPQSETFQGETIYYYDFADLSGASSRQVQVGDLVLKKSDILYWVVHVATDVQVVEIGSIKGADGNAIWRTSAAPSSVTVMGVTRLYYNLSDLSGASGRTPQQGDIIVKNGTFLYYVRGVLGDRCEVAEIGSIKGDTGATGQTGPAGQDGADGNQIWWTNGPIVPPSPSIAVDVSNLSGGKGSPKAKDYVIGPAADMVSTEPTKLYSIKLVSFGMAALTEIGSIKGADGQDGQDGAPGVGVPSGGTAGQVLAKASGTNYDTEWVDQSGGGSISPYTSNPAALGTASPGSSDKYARGDHVHPDNIFVITYTEANGSVTCDKTYAQITAALQAKKPISAVYVSSNAVAAQITSIRLGGDGNSTWLMFSLVSNAGETYLKHYSGNTIVVAATDYVTSVNGQNGAVTLSIPSTASDVGAVAVAQGVAHAGEFVVVGSDGNVTTMTLSTWQGGSY